MGEAEKAYLVLETPCVLNCENSAIDAKAILTIHPETMDVLGGTKMKIGLFTSNHIRKKLGPPHP